MIRPGLVSVTFRQLTPFEIVRLAASCGLEGIEWGGDLHVRDVGAAREVRRLTLDAGLCPVAYGSYWRCEGEFGEVAEIAAALDAPTVRVWAGTRGSRETDDAERARIVEALRSACELASEADMTISLEWHGGTLTDTLESTLRLHREVGHPALRLYWQPVPERSHSERLGELRAVLPWLSNLHVFQWTRVGGQTERHPLTEGEAEWREVLREAATTEGEALERFALLEFVPGDDPAVLAAEAATLRGWLSSER